MQLVTTSNSNRKYFFVCLFVLVSFFGPNIQAQEKLSLKKRILKLEQTIKELVQRQQLLEARIRELEHGNLGNSPRAIQQKLIDANKDGLLVELNELASYAYEYRVKPITMGGGGGSYGGFYIPSRLQLTQQGSYSSKLNGRSIMITGRSVLDLGSITVVVDSTGRLTSFTYSGDFQ